MFTINTVSIYIFGLLVLGRFTERHYVAYSVFYITGTVLCLNIPFVNFQAVTSSEHMASHGEPKQHGPDVPRHGISPDCLLPTH